MIVPATPALAPRRWRFRAPAAEPASVAALVASLNLPEPVCRLLAQRGYGTTEEAKEYLRPRLEQLHPPELLAGIDAAVARLSRAIDRGEIILVHGDYDVDGVSAVALYTRVLRDLGGRAEPFVPRRLLDGYDLTAAGVRAAREAGATLILTADCGTVAHEAVDEAARAGIDVVVTDHHTPGPTLPAAVAVVNPNRADCGYPDRSLSGAGVAFKVAQALLSARGADPGAALHHLDLVALATVADLVPLVGENRVLVRYGLRLLAATRKPGLAALVRRAGLADPEQITAGQVSHVLAPRVNAVGRLDDALWGVRLLLTEDIGEAEAIAERLEQQNRTRQAVDRDTLRAVMQQLERSFDPERDYALVLAAEGWHPGVIGIVASRVVEQVHRPTVLIALDPSRPASRGSARSIRGFHLHRALSECAGFLERFGGHTYAAGLEIRPERIPEFAAAFNDRARAALTPEDLVEEVEIDVDLPLNQVDGELHRMLRHFAPFGAGNPAPVFAAHGVCIAGRPRIVGDGHVKLDLSQDGTRLPAIGFRMADRLRALDVTRGPVDVAFQLQEDRWNGRVQLQARLVDVRPAG